MSKKLKYKSCMSCKGALLPKRDHKSNDWLLVCENGDEKKCFQVFLEEEAQDVFKELEKWKINEFEIHDLFKIGKSPLLMLQAISYVNNLDLKVYKKRVEALRELLNSYLGFFIAGLIVKLKYKLPSLFFFLKTTVLIIIILFSLGALSLINLSFEDEFIEISKPNENIIENKIVKENDSDTNEKEESFSTPLDSDNDGITDSDEINIYQTNPLDSDTDGDGYSDYDEIKAGYDPLN